MYTHKTHAVITIILATKKYIKILITMIIIFITKLTKDKSYLVAVHS